MTTSAASAQQAAVRERPSTGLWRDAWGRLLKNRLAILGLFSFPFGTALSVYTLWVLFSNEGAALFNGPRPSATY